LLALVFLPLTFLGPKFLAFASVIGLVTYVLAPPPRVLVNITEYCSLKSYERFNKRYFSSLQKQLGGSYADGTETTGIWTKYSRCRWTSSYSLSFSTSDRPIWSVMGKQILRVEYKTLFPPLDVTFIRFYLFCTFSLHISCLYYVLCVLLRQQHGTDFCEFNHARIPSNASTKTYPHIITNCRFIRIFNKMVLIFLGVLVQKFMNFVIN